ncbi:hypothetical protein JW921_01100, partial [Candidatus Fermentibacterales bacterium]|nr:hypothetical protein [Candidatus Fermentibacterales bacterium]
SWLPLRPLRWGYLLLLLALAIVFLIGRGRRPGERVRLLSILLLAGLLHSFQSLVAVHCAHYAYAPSAFFVVLLMVLLAGPYGEAARPGRAFPWRLAVPAALLLAWVPASFRGAAEIRRSGEEREAIFEAVSERMDMLGRDDLSFVVLVSREQAIRRVKLLPFFVEYLAGPGRGAGFRFAEDSAVVSRGDADGLVVWDGDSLSIRLFEP